MYLGAAYYPEHITSDRVAADAELMQAAGVNLARMGEFAWVFMEPDDGRFDFAWLDHAIETLAHRGVQTLLCTPTASPPKWLMDKHPDIYQVYENGERREWGRRREYCVSSRNYHLYTERVVAALAEHYRDNPHVIGYQLDNEFMAEKPYCYCETCQNDFRAWLQGKYGSLEAFNRRCGTAFWGLSYRCWDEIVLPRQDQNPSLVLEMYRFFSDAYLKYARLQTDILHSLSPGKPVTHNICSSGFINNLDLYRLGDIVDIAAVDNYPLGWTLETELRNYDPIPYDPAMASLALAYTRAVKKAPFWVTEKQISSSSPLPPGLARLWTYQEMAHGGRMFLFFPWRACPYGVENLGRGILDYDSVPRGRYFEVQRIARELAALPVELEAAHVWAQAAILRDFDSDWALMADPYNAQHRYQRHIYRFSQALFRNQLTVDVVAPTDDWSPYRLLIVPSLLLLDDALAARLEAFARAGGTLVLTFLSGLRDTESVFIPETFPGRLRSLAGVEIEEQDNHRSGGTAGVRWLEGSGLTGNDDCVWWSDLLKPTTAQVLAVYDERRQYAGTPAITMNAFGKGKVIYLGTQPSTECLQAFVAHLATECGIQRPVVSASPLVEVVHARSGDTRYVFVHNFSQEPQMITLNRPHTLLASGQPGEGSVIIPPMDAVILTER
ncbi:MAG: beta-galactosidase [Anaerolineae bacterium]|nr:beta-galactosidase [Anaerolineae bacterium]